jgi:cellulose synthase/poly-beta-1,6-N-acetylglucosamine synthase-like glycosyltransferase
MSATRLSAVVCTHDRPEDLRRCLEAFASLADPVEVIVVDSASTPPCRELVEAHAPWIADLTYLREEAPGLSRARNRGLQHATGAIVAFVDDDAAPRPDWGRRIVEPFDSDPRAGCVGGACHAFFPDCERPRWLSDRLLQFAGITRFTTARDARSSAEWPFGANIAFRREALDAAGGFPEHLGRTGTALLSGEESAAIEAVLDAGWSVVLHPDAAVDHAVPASRCVSSYYWRRLWWTGVTRARMGRRRGRTLARLLAAAPVRFALYVATWDRVHLYRLAETAGFVRDLATPRPFR